MSKKMKVLVAVVVAILVLTVGGAAMVMAQEEEPAPTPTPEIESNAFLQKVAEILGIPVEELTSIFQQARQDLRQDAFEQFVNSAVEEGLITDIEAQQILQWWEQRPEAVNSLFPRFFGRRQMMGPNPSLPPGQAFQGPPPWAGGPREWNPVEPPLPEE